MVNYEILGKGLKQFFKFNYGTINVGLAALTKGARLFMLECITGVYSRFHEESTYRVG